jgi:hypothetical protein
MIPLRFEMNGWRFESAVDYRMCGWLRANQRSFASAGAACMRARAIPAGSQSLGESQGFFIYMNRDQSLYDPAGIERRAGGSRWEFMMKVSEFEGISM